MFFHKVTNLEEVTASIESLASFIVGVAETCYHECSSKCISCERPWCSYEKTLAWLESQAESDK